MNKNLMTKNLEAVLPGANPAVDVMADLQYKKAYTINSWFAIGHFSAEGETLNYLYHIMIGRVMGVRVLANSSFSVTNETTGWYAGEDIGYAGFRAKIRKDRFSIHAPNGYMEGDFDHMKIGARMKRASLDVNLKAVGYPLYNKGTGVFDMLDMQVHQYSIPTMETSGTITIEGRTYTLEGLSWFDRQWQSQKFGLAGKWTWMDLNLDNGKRISLWDAIDKKGNSMPWTTIVDENDGAHTVADMVSLSEGIDEYWTSKKTGYIYPIKWVVKIPSVNADLEVVPAVRDQEIKGLLTRYEGASTVKGTYDGHKVTGYCYVEMVGDWREK